MIGIAPKEQLYIIGLGEKLDLKLRELYDELVIVQGYNEPFEAFAFHVSKMVTGTEMISKIELLPMMLKRNYSHEGFLLLPKDDDSQLKVSKHNKARRARFIARQKSKK